MKLEEIQARLNEGEKLECPTCNYFALKTGTCLLIICENPFLGPMPEEVENRIIDAMDNLMESNN